MRPRKSSTRAESVRARRKRADERLLVTQSLERPTHRRAAAEPTPSVARNVTVDAATVRAKPKPARQFQVIEAAPAQAGVQTRSLPRIRVGWRLLSFFLVILLGGAAYYAYTQPMFKAQSATLVGNTYISADEINAVANVDGIQIFLIQPAEIERTLRLTFPEISSVHVTVDLPNLVTVTISERLPVVRWEQGNAYTWIDEAGIALRPRGDAPNLVVVKAAGTPPAGSRSNLDAFAPSPYVNADLVKAARLLAPYAPQGSSLQYDPTYGLGWADPRGWMVWFGSSSDRMDVKLRVYVVLVDSLNQRGITPVLINVAYPDAPYYRLGQ